MGRSLWVTGEERISHLADRIPDCLRVRKTYFARVTALTVFPIAVRRDTSPWISTDYSANGLPLKKLGASRTPPLRILEERRITGPPGATG
jgi:hypothetical protein